MTRRSFTPRPCQYPIINHIVEHPRCAVWADMGLGKTSGVLAAIDQLALVDDVYPVLVIAPLRVARSTWKDEVAKWEEFGHLEVETILGSADQRCDAVRRPADIYTINYENLPWLIEWLGPEHWKFKTIVADESTKLKGFRIGQGTQRAKALARVAHQTPRFINLTGTPSPNGLKDLWGQTWFLDAGVRLGRSYDAFESRWFAYQRVRDAISHKVEIKPIILPNAQEQIEGRLKDICISVNAADYFDLKEPIICPVYVDLPPAARALYTEMEKRLFIELEGHEIEAFNAAAKTMKCLQLASGAAYVDPAAGDDTHPKAKQWVVVHDEKLLALEDIIEEAAGMPVIVAYQFKSDLARLKKHFPTGRVLDTKKDEDDFKAGLIPILFAHPKSASHGIDGFQYVTNKIALFGHDWNLEDYMQIIERIGPVRQMQAGLDRPVFIYPIIARDTMDEVVMERRAGKREVQDLLLEAMKRRKS